MRANPPTYNVETLGKEFVESYGYQHPKHKFDEFDVYEVPKDDATAEPVLVEGGNVELLPGEATPHTLIVDGIATDDDWCAFLNDKRMAVNVAGPLILSIKQMDSWARSMRKQLPPKKFGKTRTVYSRIIP